MKTVVCTWASAAFALAAAAKTPVTPPTLEDKPYTGERQTATVPAGNWTVMPYSGWTAAGTYSRPSRVSSSRLLPAAQHTSSRASSVGSAMPAR